MIVTYLGYQIGYDTNLVITIMIVLITFDYTNSPSKSKKGQK